MDMIHKQRNSIPAFIVDCFLAFLLPLFHKLMVKLNQQKRLVLDICE
jgi:hypothetical protein